MAEPRDGHSITVSPFTVVSGHVRVDLAAVLPPSMSVHLIRGGGAEACRMVAGDVGMSAVLEAAHGVEPTFKSHALKIGVALKGSHTRVT